MKKLLSILLLAALLAACGPTATEPVATETLLPTDTSTPAPTATPTLEPTPSYPPEGYGPANFPSDVNPLTGLQVADPSLLERRPLLIKVSNLPRTVRPQWGLSLADIVFEYYTEEGTTRFAAIFYGNDAEMVGPIRSARFVDSHLVRGYKAVFAYGGAYEKVTERLFNSGFTDRLIIEGASTPLFRYDPNGFNHLMVNTADLSAFATEKGIENGRQLLDGMFFQLEAPAGGQAGEQFIVRYSGSIYNRWEYDAETGKYLRYVDTTDDFNLDNEQYELLTDRLTDQPIAFDNVAVLFVVTDHYNVSPEVVDIQFVGSGAAYAYRDGQVYQVTWQRNANDVVTLLNADGTPFAFKPGTTWFEVVGMNTTVTETDQGLRFRHLMP
jgi:hypothetical protein